MLPCRPVYTYDGAMKQKGDSGQGSLFLDRELPLVEQGRVPSSNNAPVALPAEAPTEPVRLHLRRRSESRFPFARWWRALVGGR